MQIERRYVLKRRSWIQEYSEHIIDNQYMQLNSEDHKAIFIAIREYESVTYLNTDKIKNLATSTSTRIQNATWQIDDLGVRLNNSFLYFVAITTIQGSSGRDLTTLLGTSLYDTIRINNNNLYLDTREGNDVISADESIEAITIDAGSDNDILTFESEAIDSTFKLGRGW